MCDQTSLEFSSEEIRLAKMMKALGNPTRLVILKLLAECSPCICSNIVLNLPLAQSTVSQHLKVLKEAGFIIGEAQGQAIFYYPDRKNIEWLMQEAAQFIGQLLDQSGDYEQPG